VSEHPTSNGEGRGRRRSGVGDRRSEDRGRGSGDHEEHEGIGIAEHKALVNLYGENFMGNCTQLSIKFSPICI
jgi:hypothetical protein